MENISHINSGCSDADEISGLRKHPIIIDFANVKPDVYELIKATNPTLKMMIDLARNIMEAKV